MAWVQNGLLRVHTAYTPLVTTLEYPGFLKGPTTVSILCAPDLLLTKQMAPAIFLGAPKLGNKLRRSVAEVHGWWVYLQLHVNAS